MAKRNIFRGLAAVLALGMCMTGLAGCGNEKRADGKTEIEVVSYKPEAVKAFEKIEKRFNETYKYIKYWFWYFTVIPIISKVFYERNRK